MTIEYGGKIAGFYGFAATSEFSMEAASQDHFLGRLSFWRLSLWTGRIVVLG